MAERENVGKLSAGHSGSLFSSSPCVTSVGFVKMGLRRCVKECVQIQVCRGAKTSVRGESFSISATKR